MAEYIKREALLEKAKKLAGGSFSTPLIISEIEKTPTADVVKVVRCKDCELFVDNKKAFVQYCKRECKHITVKPNDFCSYGKRKEGAEG